MASWPGVEVMLSRGHVIRLGKPSQSKFSDKRHIKVRLLGKLKPLPRTVYLLRFFTLT
jgi:hypothetical protein